MAANVKVAPYGAWKSRITTDLLVQKNVSLGHTLSYYSGVPSSLASANTKFDSLLWQEARPSEQGRVALLRIDVPKQVTASKKALSDERPTTDVTQGKFNVRSGVHEYGGGASAVLADGSVLFTHFGEWGVYRVLPASEGEPNAQPERVDPEKESGVWRFADFAPHPTVPHLVAAIREDHTEDTPATVINDLVLLDLQRKAVTVLAHGSDFYANPAFSSSGTKLAYTKWSHPHMPFWNTDLAIVSFDPEQQAVTSDEVLVTKKPASSYGEVLQQPKWQPTSSPPAADATEKLLFTSDRTQFANIYSVQVTPQNGKLAISEPELVLNKVLDADAQKPAWILAWSTYAFLDPTKLFVVLTKGVSDTLALFDLEERTHLEISAPFRGADDIVALSPTRIAANFTSDDAATELATIDLSKALEALSDGKLTYALTADEVVTIKRTSDVVSNGDVPSDWFSIATEIKFPTTLPDGSASEAYACLFPPRNPEYAAPEGTKPPCLITIHGGPTSSAHAGLSLNVAYWTSRGWLVAALNYGGSTGYGREYVDRLNRQWGVVDVEDCAALARYLGRSDGSTPTAEAQLPLLSITDAPDGSVTASLDQHNKSWGIKDVVAGLLISAAGAGLTALSPLTPLIAAAATSTLAGAYLVSKASAVQRESVQAIPGVGLQISTTRGLRMPWNDKPGQLLAARTKQHLVPRADVSDLVVHESISTYSIATGVAVAPKDGQQLIRLFPGTQPRIPLIQRIYPALLRGLFPDEKQHCNVASKGGDVTKADPERIVVSGGSSGGYTVLAALVAHPTAFKAGTSRYGISELSALFRDSHKFENYYPEVLLGGTPDTAPEVYRQRSPLYGASKIRAPLLVLQGGVDRVVPPPQSEDIVRQIESQPGGKDRVKYVLFPDEGHGFRQAANQKRSLEEEAGWYAAKLQIDHQF